MKNRNERDKRRTIIQKCRISIDETNQPKLNLATSMTIGTNGVIQQFVKYEFIEQSLSARPLTKISTYLSNDYLFFELKVKYCERMTYIVKWEMSIYKLKKIL